MEMTVRQMLGQKLIFGFQGEQMSEEFVSLVRQYKIGNVILFLRNVKSAGQLRALCAQIQELIQAETGYPALIVIDQEGGMVTRLPQDGVNVPCPMSLAATGDPENARQASEITIRQLRGLGVNFNMAPVLDVNSNPANPVIGIRSFGDDPERVAAFGAEAVEPYLGSGVLCCGKHFPGHGDTAVDSHLGLPRVDKTEEELEALELIPFRKAIQAGIPAIMISHVLFPRLEERELPCTMSRRMVTGLLKQKLGFNGLILTDCMEMGAIRDYFGTPEGVVASFKAGVDLAEISHTIRLEWSAARAVNEAAQRGELDMEELRASVEKILRFKKTLCLRVDSAGYGREEDRLAVAEMTRRAVTCWAGTPLPAGKRTFFCGCQDFRASAAGNEDGSAGPFPEYMGRAFGAPWAVTSQSPGEEEIRETAALAAQYDSIVLSTCSAHLFRGQIALAEALAATGKPLTVAALRNPYDLSDLPDCQCKIAAYDYSLPCFRALEEIFRGGAMTGKAPVKL